MNRFPHFTIASRVEIPNEEFEVAISHVADSKDLYMLYLSGETVPNVYTDIQGKKNVVRALAP